MWELHSHKMCEVIEGILISKSFSLIPFSRCFRMFLKYIRTPAICRLTFTFESFGVLLCTHFIHPFLSSFISGECADHCNNIIYI